jgi:demethylmenaquinone methyltransferase/2-methoxy-6-polyprenyl-1,4-benzoquinol methylase
MVSLAREKGRSKDLAHKVTFVLGDAHALPFPNDSFACATAGFSLRNMSNLDQALSEMVRVVRPGGRVSTLELTPMRPGRLSTLMRIYTQGLVPILGRLIARDRAAYTYLPQSVDHFIDAGTLAGRFQDLGLTGVSYRRLGFGAVTLHWGEKPKMELGSTSPATG